MSIYRTSVIRTTGALLTAIAAVFAFAGSIHAHGGARIELQDKCDPATFNAVLGPGVCVGDGDVTFAELFEKVNPKDGGHGAWRNSRRTLTIDAGEVVHIVNTGGEPHTFTEVANFGAGIVPELNHALRPGTPPAVPLEPITFLAAGESLHLRNLSVGTHRYECLIHPWMRTVVTVERD